MNSVYMIACGCTGLDSYLPGLAAQGWDSLIQRVATLATNEKVAPADLVGSELRVLLLELGVALAL